MVNKITPNHRTLPSLRFFEVDHFFRTGRPSLFLFYLNNYIYSGRISTNIERTHCLFLKRILLFSNMVVHLCLFSYCKLDWILSLFYPFHPGIGHDCIIIRSSLSEINSTLANFTLLYIFIWLDHRITLQEILSLIFCHSISNWFLDKSIWQGYLIDTFTHSLPGCGYHGWSLTVQLGEDPG